MTFPTGAKGLSMSHRLRGGAVVLLALGSLLASRPAMAANNKDIDASIQKGVAWLYTQQNAAGNFELDPAPLPDVSLFTVGNVESAQWGGLTSLTVYGLLTAGEDPTKNAKLAQATDWLKEHELKGTYAESVRAFNWPLYKGSQSGIHEAAMRDAKLLVNALRLTGGPRGLTGYHLSIHVGPEWYNDPWWDHSSSLYDVLAVDMLDGMGCEIPDAYWQEVDRRWRADQLDDGGWCYHMSPGRPAADMQETMNMTASGVAVLFICQDHLDSASDCSGTPTDKQIDNGLTWMDQHYAEAMLPRGGERYWLYNYGMYAVERVGLLSGRKYFNGTRDWYKEGVDMLLKTQKDDGSWKSLPDTVFAVAFLCHGRAPVIMNKLQYDGNWNERRRDLFHLARWSGHALEREITWQSVTLKVPVEDLHESPILYIAGKGALNFNADELAKLKLFVEQGGIIFGNADCGDVAFTQNFKKLGITLWPDFEWQKIGADDTLLHDEQFRAQKWANKPDLIGLTNGIRQFMLLCPNSDPAHAWQQDRGNGKRDAFELAQDVFLYSVDRDQFWNRGDTYVLPGPGTGGTAVARLQYNGLWDPEPGAWRQFSNFTKNTWSAQPVMLGAGQLSAYKIADLTGNGRFTLNAKQKAELKQFVDGGGVLILDACGGLPGFGKSAEALMAELWPDGKLDILPQSSGIYAGIDAIGWRATARRILNAAGGAGTGPQLEGLTLKGRVAVYYSPQDITEGLVGQPVDGIDGYTPDTAAKLMQNILNGAK
jgi:hypothetical protein